MKRIIDGVTYNTATSTMLARSEYPTQYNHQEYQCEGTLYQTRGGAFFVHEQIDLGWDRDREEQIYRDRFDTLSAKGAQDWIMTGETEVFHNPFEEPPEAEAESEPSATIYVRVPVSLKRRLEQAAVAEKLSGNSWSIRCIERCLSPSEEVRADIGFIWWLARQVTHNKELLSEGDEAKIAEAIADIVEHRWKALGFEVEGFVDDSTELASARDYGRQTNAILGR